MHLGNAYQRCWNLRWKLYGNFMIIVNSTWVLCSWKTVMTKQSPHLFVLQEVTYCKESPFQVRLKGSKMTPPFVNLWQGLQTLQIPILCLINDELGGSSPLTHLDNMTDDVTWTRPQAGSLPKLPFALWLVTMQNKPLSGPFQGKRKEKKREIHRETPKEKDTEREPTALQKESDGGRK